MATPKQVANFILNDLRKYARMAGVRDVAFITPDDAASLLWLEETGQRTRQQTRELLEEHAKSIKGAR
jgi:Asp-tRNA(Asn)/Glu-tRNA(Gln) amidotransferase B subunit